MIASKINDKLKEQFDFYKNQEFNFENKVEEIKRSINIILTRTNNRLDGAIGIIIRNRSFMSGFAELKNNDKYAKEVLQNLANLPEKDAIIICFSGNIIFGKEHVPLMMDHNDPNPKYFVLSFYLKDRVKHFYKSIEENGTFWEEIDTDDFKVKYNLILKNWGVQKDE